MTVTFGISWKVIKDNSLPQQQQQPPMEEPRARGNYTEQWRGRDKYLPPSILGFLVSQGNDNDLSGSKADLLLILCLKVIQCSCPHHCVPCHFSDLSFPGVLISSGHTRCGEKEIGRRIESNWRFSVECSRKFPFLENPSKLGKFPLLQGLQRWTIQGSVVGGGGW